MATHRPAFGRPITANILSQGKTAQPGNTPTTLGNPPATVSKPFATTENAFANLGEAPADLETPLAAFGIGLAHPFPFLGIHLPP